MSGRSNSRERREPPENNRPRKFVAVPRVIAKDTLRRLLEGEKEKVALLTEKLDQLKVDKRVLQLRSDSFAQQLMDCQTERKTLSDELQATAAEVKHLREVVARLQDCELPLPETSEELEIEPEPEPEPELEPEADERFEAKKCVEELLTCQSFKEFYEKLTSALDEQWLWHSAYEADLRLLEQLKDGDASVHSDYVLRPASYRLTELRTKILCELLGVDVQIPIDFAYGRATPERASKSSDDDNVSRFVEISIEDALERLIELWEKLELAPPEAKEGEQKRKKGVVGVLRLSPDCWKQDRIKTPDTESEGSVPVRSQFEDDSPAIEEFARHVCLALETILEAPPRSKEECGQLVMFLAVGVSGWWRASGWNAAITKQLVTLATTEAVQRQYGLYLARLNRIGRSPELVLHGVNCLHQVYDAGLPVLEYIQQANTVAPLLWEHVPDACQVVLVQGDSHRCEYERLKQVDAMLAKRGIKTVSTCKYGCGFKLEHAYSMFEHKFSCALAPKIYCDWLCGTQFKSSNAMSKHKFGCKNRPPVLCVHGCGYAYKSVPDKFDHKFKCNNLERVLCEAGCGHTYESKNDVFDHKFKCKNRPRERCERCKHEYTSRGNRYSHTCED
ncbi:MAG: hypothetical protein MHM6MM_006042 [Cercozoa sp. M6MM]